MGMVSSRAVLETSDEGLYRALSRWNALAIVVGAVIGTGIYLRPASIAQLVHAPAVIVGVWVGAGLLSMAGALTYSDLAARLPRSGKVGCPAGIRLGKTAQG